MSSMFAELMNIAIAADKAMFLAYFEGNMIFDWRPRKKLSFESFKDAGFFNPLRLIFFQENVASAEGF